MGAQHALIEQGIPDLIDTEALPTAIAAEIDFLAGRFERWTERGGPMLRARALIGLGAAAEATDLIRNVDAATLHGTELRAGAWAVSRLGPSSAAKAILAVLEHEPDFLTADEIPLGPRSLAQGPLLAAIGDLEAAEDRLIDAIERGDARAPLWGAISRVELARIKMSVLAVGDADPAAVQLSIDRLLNSARLFFRAGGYRSMLTRTDAMSSPAGHLSPCAPNVGRLLAGAPWHVGFGVACDVTVRSSKSLVAIRHLVQNPGRAVPAVEIDRVVNGGDPLPLDALMERIGSDPGDTLDDEIRAVLFDESVRSRVGKLLTRGAGRLEEQHPLLGTHLRGSMRTGHVCRYEPPADASVVWLT